MKIFLKSCLSISLFLCCLNFVAAKPLECPPKRMIADVDLKHAVQFDEAWFLIGRIFHQNHNWQVIFGFPLMDITTKKEALEKGKIIFKKVTLREPTVLDQPNVTCMYTDSDRYFVEASEKPIP